MRKIIIPVLIMMLTASCVTYKKCCDKFGELSKPKVIITDDSIKVETITDPDSLQGGIDLDTLCEEWRRYSESLSKGLLENDSLKFVNDSLTEISASGKLSTKYWIDRYNRLLRFKSKVERDTIIKVVHEKDTVQCPPCNCFTNLPWHRKAWEGYKTFAAYALLLLIFVLFVAGWWKRIMGGGQSK